MGSLLGGGLDFTLFPFTIKGLFLVVGKVLIVFFINQKLFLNFFEFLL